MATIDVKARQINCKLVYYGTGMGGKTTNLRYIYKKTNPKQRGKLLSLETESERTLFFDFFPMSAGKLKGLDLRFSFYTVPGQSFYNLTRKTILKDVDGVAFIGDSHVDREDANIDSYLNLEENLLEHRIELAKFPHVIQYNKRDLDEVIPVEDLRRDLNLYGVPDFEAVATEGDGVFDTLRTIVKLVTAKVKSELL
ncbi:MAG: gliding-motility protein MglA [Deltaproteobacteria bacterium]|nr:MAG: gliding-motility protein MglA [Deltaproteobacteria bacterium]